MYNIKIYDRSGENLYKVLLKKLIESNYSFSETINFGQQQFSFSYYGGRFAENSIEGEVNLFKNRNIVELFQGGVLIYTGWVLSVTAKHDKRGFRYEVKVSGLASLLSKVTYTGNSQVTNPSTAIISCITDLNTKLGLNISTSKIQTYPTPSDWTIKNAKNCVDVLNQVMENTSDRYFFLNENKEAIFQPYTDGENSTLIFGQDVSLTSLENDTTTIVNKIYVDWEYYVIVDDVKQISVGSVVVLNQASIDEYGLLEKKIYLSQKVNSDATATSYGENLLSKEAEKQFNSIRLESPQSRKGLHPGDNITVRNTKEELKNDIIKKISYNKSGAEIETKEYESLEQFLTPNS